MGVKNRLKIKIIDGRKQNPVDTDFHITPCLTYATADHEGKKAYGIGIEFGYWAIVLALFIL